MPKRRGYLTDFAWEIIYNVLLVLMGATLVYLVYKGIYLPSIKYS